MGRKVKIGLIQVNQIPEDRYEQRLDILENMARDCYEEGAELVFFPEAYQHVPDRSVKSDHDRLVRLYNGWLRLHGNIMPISCPGTMSPDTMAAYTTVRIS